MGNDRTKGPVPKRKELKGKKEMEGKPLDLKRFF